MGGIAKPPENSVCITKVGQGVLGLTFGDESNLSDLLSELFPKIKRTTYFITRDYELAQEAAVETLVRIWLNRDKIPAVDNLDAWVYHIALNESRKLLRSKRRWSWIPLRNRDAAATLSEASSSEGLPDKAVEEIVIRSAIRQLDLPHREVIFLRFFADLDEGTMARVLKCSRGTIKSRLHRAIRRLRTILGLMDEG